MKVTLYSTIDKRSKLNKALENEFITEMIFKSATSMFKPVLYVSNNLLATPIEKYNYLYIGEWGRYYFIDDIVFDRNNYTMITCTEDVLMSFKDNIMNFDAHIYRCSDEGYKHTSLRDDMLNITNSYRYDILYNSPFFNILASGDTMNSSSRCFVVCIVGDVSDFSSFKSGVDVSNQFIRTPASLFRSGAGYYNRWVLNAQQMSILAEKIIENSELASFILSINAFPFDFSSYIASKGDTFISGNLTINNIVIIESTESNPVYRLRSYEDGIISGTIGRDSDLYVGDNTNYVKIEKKYNDCRDYEPFVSYSMYIPFYGNVDIQAQDLYDGIHFNCVVDFLTGSCNFVIFKQVGNNVQKVIKDITFTLSLQIPINSTNAQEIKREQQSINASAATSGVIGALQAILGAILTATGVGAGLGVGLMAGGLVTVAGGTGSWIAKGLSIPDETAYSSNGSQNLCMYKNQYISILKKTMRVTASEEKISTLYGYPCDIYAKLNNLGLNKGTIIYIDNFHDNALSQTPYMMNNEVDSIKEQLLKGIII